MRAELNVKSEWFTEADLLQIEYCHCCISNTYLFPSVYSLLYPMFVLASVVSRYTTAPNPHLNTEARILKTYAVMRNKMTVNKTWQLFISVFSDRACVTCTGVRLWTSWCVSVLTALQVNKPQLPVSVLVFPRNFDGQSAETVVGDVTGACLGSYLLCNGRHHFH